MEAPGSGGRRRLPQRLGAEDEALNQIARQAEARLAAKRAARAEAREIRMKELERQQKEIYQVQKKYYGLDTKWGDIEQWMEDSERYSHRSRRNTSVSDEDERMSVGSRGSLRGNYNSDLGLPGCGTNAKAQPATQNGSRTPLYDDSVYSGSRRYSACSSRGQPSEYSGYLGSGSRPSSRTSSARASPVVEERPDKDFNDKGARTASSLSAATLASLGGTSSRRGSGDTSISVDTEASIREIKDISELKDQIEDVEGRYMQGLKEMKDSLAEVEEKYKKAMVSNAQLDNEKTNFMYQVDTLKDVLLELEEQLAETHRQYEDKSKEFEREKHSHRILQTQYNELKESLQQRDELLTEIRQLQQKQECNGREITDLQETIEWKDKKIGALERQKEFFDSVRSERDELRDEVAVLKEELKRHGIVLSSDLSPNGGILDGPLREALVESSTKVMDNTAPTSKTGDGPLGRASEAKMKSETAEEGQSVQSSKTAEVKSAAKAQKEETSLLSEREEDAECSMATTVGQACTSADGQTESVTTAGEQVAKAAPIQNEDSIKRPGIGLEASTVVNGSSSEASEGHIKKTDTLQTQRDVEIKGSRENQLGEVEIEGAACSEKESTGDVFQDAVEFASGQNVNNENELHHLDKGIVATNEEPQEKPLLESPREGFNVQGILQNLGRRLDMTFDAVNHKEDGPVNGASDISEESNPKLMHQELEGSGVSPQQLGGDKNSELPTEGVIARPNEAAGTQDGEGIASEKLLGRSVVISSSDNGSVAVGGSIQGRADGGVPFPGMGIEPDVVLSGKCITLGDNEVKNHVKEVDLEGKAHSDDGEFYECVSEGSNPNAPALEAKLGEEPLNSKLHQEDSNTGFTVSSPRTLEEMDINTNEQPAEIVGDDPSQLSHMHNHDTQLHNAKVNDEKFEEQGIEGDATITFQGHDHKEAGIDKTASQRDLGESEQSGSIQGEGNSLEFNEDGENVNPSPAVTQEFPKGSAEAAHINVSTPNNTTELPVEAVPKFQSKGILTEGNNDAHEEGLSPETTAQETEVPSLPPSKETSNIEIKHDLQQPTQTPGVETPFAEPSEPLGLSDSSGYSKEDALDRNVKRTKSKSKEDCLLS